MCFHLCTLSKNGLSVSMTIKSLLLKIHSFKRVSDYSINRYQFMQFRNLIFLNNLFLNLDYKRFLCISIMKIKTICTLY